MSEALQKLSDIGADGRVVRPRLKSKHEESIFTLLACSMIVELFFCAGHGQITADDVRRVFAELNAGGVQSGRTAPQDGARRSDRDEDDRPPAQRARRNGDAES